MFKAKTEDTKLLKDSLNAISNLISEGIFKFNEDGIKLIAADPAMVGLVDFQILNEAFESYEIEDEKEAGLNIEKLYSIIKRTKSSDTLKLELEDNKLNITIENSSTRNFSLPVLDLDEEDIPTTQDLEFDAKADLKTSVLDKAIGDASIVGETITLTADSDNLNIKSEGDSTDVEFNIEKGSEGLLELTAEESIESMFSIDYLNKMMKGKKLADSVTLNMGNEYPMRLDFKVPDKLELSFILAPRIEEE